MTAVQLILASASPARQQVLRGARIAHSVQVSQVDEDRLLAHTKAATGGNLSPQEVVQLLATAKSRDVARDVRIEEHGARLLVLGCDSMLEIDGAVHGKPGTAQIAAERWRKMRGRTGSLHTGHWLIDAHTGAEVGGVSTTEIDFADVTDQEISAYVGTGEPLEVAGACTIDGIGGPFITGLRGDHHGVIGLSLPLLRQLLSSLGIQLHQLWDN